MQKYSTVVLATGIVLAVVVVNKTLKDLCIRNYRKAVEEFVSKNKGETIKGFNLHSLDGLTDRELLKHINKF